MPVLLLVLLYYRMRMMAWLFGSGMAQKLGKLTIEHEMLNVSLVQINKEASMLRETVARLNTEKLDLEKKNTLLSAVSQKRLESISDLEVQVHDLEAAVNTLRLECDATDVLLLGEREKLKQMQQDLDDCIQEKGKLLMDCQVLADQLNGLKAESSKDTVAKKVRKPKKKG